MEDVQDIKRAVRERYAGHAAKQSSCCGTSAPATSSCCDSGSASASEAIGYEGRDLDGIPEGADLGLGCGNPLAMLGLKEGETVLDLGSGGGIDCFLAAKRVGASGRVIGVDMTPEMIDRARRNAVEGGYANVEFRLGEVENLPVADAEVDAIISNCVINLVPDKARAFREAFRALKPGGRLSISDIVTLGPIPDVVRESAEAYVACLAGAIHKDDYLGLLREAGFEEVSVTHQQVYDDIDDAQAEELAREYRKHTGIDADEVRRAAALFASVSVQAVKP